jgi:hypothetical protein
MRKEIASILTPGEQVKPSRYQVVGTTSDMARVMQSSITGSIEEVAIVKAALYFEGAGEMQVYNQEQADRSALYFLHNLQLLVRKTDRVFLLDHVIYFILPGANGQGGSIVEERLWDALLWRIHNAQEVHEIDILVPQRVTMGYSATAWPCDELLAILHEADMIRHSFALHHELPTSQETEQPVEEPPQQSEDRELRLLARELGIPYLMFLPRKSATKVRRLLSPQLALELHCYPLGREGDILTVAMSNPQDRHALDRLQQETGLHIFPVLAPSHELQTALEQLV